MFYIFLLIISIIGLGAIFTYRYILTKKGLHWQKTDALNDKNLDKKEEFTIDDEEIDIEIDKKFIKLDKILMDVDNLIKDQDFDSAQKTLIEVLANHGESSAIQHRLAKIYMIQKQYHKAEGIYEILIQKHPNAVYFTNLGLCYYVKGDFDTAVKAYQKALEIDSNRKERFINLARVYEQMGEMKKAREQYENWVKRETKDIDALLVLAAYSEQDGDTAKALEIYRKILDLSPYHEIAKAKTQNM
ncbi:hypothetical protein A2335_01480 [Candidatus Peregrinibacteria bacterium RIFOXYB2_FULL_32_7]|nr:MAG: hypothetical protein A2335_01480 [Candidatus Peregrinibacteria bacterium RIFOXYB2_FULL_32_7]